MSPIRSITVRNQHTGEAVQFPLAGQLPSFVVPPEAALTVHLVPKEGAAKPKLQLKKAGHDLVLESEHGEVLVLSGFYQAPSASLDELSFVTASGGLIETLTGNGIDSF